MKVVACGMKGTEKKEDSPLDGVRDSRERQQCVICVHRHIGHNVLTHTPPKRPFSGPTTDYENVYTLRY